jgi:Fe-S-cluster-containing dehydrogenase component
MMKLGMVIDLSRCVGCGACAFACKTENNTRNRNTEKGQSHNWADFLMHSEGTFPNTKHFVIPVLCNHCDEPPCIKICPGNPEKAGKGKPYKALFKTPEGITLHNPDLCVGCGDCQTKNGCPYSHEKLDAKSLTGETYSVISLNAGGRRAATLLGRQGVGDSRMHLLGRRGLGQGRALDCRR